MSRNPLNDKDVNGNTMAWMVSKDEGIPHIDKYKCECGNIVDLNYWSEEEKICMDCYANRHIVYHPKLGYILE